LRVPLFVASISGMRTYLALPSLILCGVLCYMPTSGLSADEQLPSFTLPESQNQIIKISDVGLLPKTLEMKKEDGIVFFLNDSTDALITIDLDFGKSATHCSSENLEIGEDGVIRSVRPIAQKDFASACFHDAGTYPFTIYGLKQAPLGLKGAILVK